MSDRETFGRAYNSRNLQQIRFLLGGIGTGQISLTGLGDLVDFELWGGPNQDTSAPCTGFWLRTEAEGRVEIRVPAATPQPPYFGHLDAWGAGTGHIRNLRWAALRYRNAVFRAAYPFARLSLSDPDAPLDVELVAFNPFVPGEAAASSIPAAVFRYTLTNNKPHPVKATMVLSMLNLAGEPSSVGIKAEAGPEGANQQQFVRHGRLAGIRLASDRFADEPTLQGRLGIFVLDEPDVTYDTCWAAGPWSLNVEDFYLRLSEQGRLADAPPSSRTTERSASVGAIGAADTIEPGESRTFTFLLAWYFPYFHAWRRAPAKDPADPFSSPTLQRRAYAERFKDELDCAAFLAENLEELEAHSLQFAEALWDSSLPADLIESASANLTILRSPTVFETADGHVFAWEGCNQQAGCCHGTCSHVWAYEQSLAFLFPQLERDIRETDFAHNWMSEAGALNFRIGLPLADPVDRSMRHAAADGQMGSILRTCREWQISGDDAWLERMWPHVVRALEYAFQQWDADRDGVMEGMQHNTYDVEFYGPHPMLTSMYHAALLAAARMAEHLGQREKAETYLDLYRKGRRIVERDMWAGEYFVPLVDDPDRHDWQLGPACHSEQLLGQWWADVLALGDLYDPEKIRTALASILKYNFREEFYTFSNLQRVYALADEQGLVICTWPHGGRPRRPFPYSDEVWTGIEYEVAALCMRRGMQDEALRILGAVRGRYDGYRRNPFNEVECGSHYARALASWSVLHAATGFTPFLAEGRLEFAPVGRPEHFRCLGGLDVRLEVLRGRLKLRSLSIYGREVAFPSAVTVTPGNPLQAAIV